MIKYLFIFSIFLLFQGCSLYKVFITPQNLIQLKEDKRIYYEHKAKDKALYIQTILDKQILHIENKQYLPLTKQPKIYIFAKQTTFEKYAVNQKAGGETQGDKRILISPKKQNSIKRLKGLLTHELSHFHLYSYVGLIDGYFLPTWFTEGLAVFVSNGIGGEKVSTNQAIEAINQKRFFYIEKKNSKPSYMNPHMFYKQSELFIKYLYNKDKEKFKQFLIKVLKKENFNTSFKTIYTESITNYSKKFKKHIKDNYGSM